MSETCTYHSQDCNTCPAPATHRVVKGVRECAWRIEEVVEKTQTMEHLVAGHVVERTSTEVPEFCLRHAGDVMVQRNRPRHREATP
jgi:hypothetical protein